MSRLLFYILTIKADIMKHIKLILLSFLLTQITIAQTTFQKPTAEVPWTTVITLYKQLTADILLPVRPLLSVHPCSTLSEVKRAIPPRLFVRQTWRGVMYVARDLVMAAAAWKLATYIDPYTMHSVVRGTIGVVPSLVLRWTCWAV